MVMVSRFGLIAKILQNMLGIHKCIRAKFPLLLKKKQGQRVVLDLVKGLGQGYGVICDNFFTSLELAKELAKQYKTLLGTIRQIRKEVPKIVLPSKSREVNSSLFLFLRDPMMVSYVPRKNKPVIFLSSQHNDQAVSTAEHAKPDIILDYNKSKGAVDSAQQIQDLKKMAVCSSHPYYQCLCFECLCALPKQISKYSIDKT